MDYYKAFLITVFSILIFSTVSLAGEKVSGEINKDQPISIGQDIYYRITNISDTTGSSYVWILRSIVYKYVGLENNNIKVEVVVSDSSTSNRIGTKETTILSLPLNPKKQTLLKVRTFSDQGEMDLIITVVDDFNRINVEELKNMR